MKFKHNIHSKASFKNYLIEGQLLYNIVLFSTICQNESARDIHVSPPFQTSLSHPTPPLSSGLLQSPGLSSLSPTAKAVGYLFYIW